MNSPARTTRFSWGRLPHWEVECGRYFVTVRCADSLPASVVARLREVYVALQAIQPRSAEFVRLQRQYFLTMEKFLHEGVGACPLAAPIAASTLDHCFEELRPKGIVVSH